MALVNDVKKEINAKIVYLGPKGAGKATALRFIYSRLRPDCRSELKSMAAGEHQMLFFDFTYPLPRRSNGYTVRFHVYTLLAGGESPPPWKMLLKGADGVVLLADSAAERMYGNLECCALLLDAIGHYGLKLEEIALSLQCNKRDLREALPLAAIKEQLLPDIETEPLPVTASGGKGLLEGLNGTVSAIMQKLGLDEAAVAVGDNEAAEALPEEEETLDSVPAGSHCLESRGFAVEAAGTPQDMGEGTVVIPLRLTGGECGKSIDFKVTVTVSL